MSRIVIITILLAVAAVWAQDTPRTYIERPLCNEDAGDCLEVHATPGCAWPDCCETVCIEFEQPWCCDDEWDQFCVAAAEVVCSPPSACIQDTGTCYEANDSRGCDNDRCCSLVCSWDSFCCGSVWDDLCAESARRFCEPYETLCAVVPAPSDVLESEACEERINDGCNGDPVAFAPMALGRGYYGTVSADIRRDTDWYEAVIDVPHAIRWTITSDFPAELSILSGDCDGGFTTHVVANVPPCESTVVQAMLAPGTYWFVVTTGSDLGPIYRGIWCDKRAEIRGQVFGTGYSMRVD